MLPIEPVAGDARRSICPGSSPAWDQRMELLTSTRLLGVAARGGPSLSVRAGGNLAQRDVDSSCTCAGTPARCSGDTAPARCPTIRSLSLHRALGLLKAPYAALAQELRHPDSTGTAEEAGSNAARPDLSEANSVIKRLNQEPEYLTALPSLTGSLQRGVERAALLGAVSPAVNVSTGAGAIGRAELLHTRCPRHGAAEACAVCGKQPQDCAPRSAWPVALVQSRHLDKAEKRNVLLISYLLCLGKSELTRGGGIFICVCVFNLGN